VDVEVGDVEGVDVEEVETSPVNPLAFGLVL
jgi:hypothetical protein